MSGQGEGKLEIKNVKVYIHESLKSKISNSYESPIRKKGKSNARITHIDIESDELSKIIKDKEATYCAGKPGGVFIGLKKEMIKRAEKLIK